MVLSAAEPVGRLAGLADIVRLVARLSERVVSVVIDFTSQLRQHCAHLICTVRLDSMLFPLSWFAACTFFLL